MGRKKVVDEEAPVEATPGSSAPAPAAPKATPKKVVTLRSTQNIARAAGNVRFNTEFTAESAEEEKLLLDKGLAVKV